MSTQNTPPADDTTASQNASPLRDGGANAPVVNERSWFGTGIKLVIASLLVGFVLAVFGANPVDFWKGLVEAITAGVTNLLGMGWEAVYTIASYIAFGAVIVIPVWLLMKLFTRKA